MSAPHTYTGGAAQQPHPGGYGSGMRPSHLRGPGSGVVAGKRSLSLPSFQNLLGRSSFVLGGGAGDGGGPSVWGRGSQTSFEARQDALTLDGDVTTGQFGSDWSSGPWLAGLSAAYSYGEGDFHGDGEGEIEANLTGLYPYIGYRDPGGPSAWATLGYGDGNLVLKPQHRGETETDISMVMGAAGVRGKVLRPDTPGGVEVALRADASFVRTTSDAANQRLLNSTSSNANRVRFGLEGARNITWENGATLTPSVEFGVLYDGGDLDAGTGADLEAGLRYAGVRGLSFDLRARSLVAHRISGTREWGVSGEFRYDPSPASERGLAFSLGSGYGGRASGGVDDIFALSITDDAPTPEGGALPGARLEAELGYGLSALGGSYTGTPWARLGIEEGTQSWRLGWRFTPFTAWAPDMEAGASFDPGSQGIIRLHIDARF